MGPKISVIMSVHNQAHYLAESIKSILTQSFSDFEFIIVNDGSKDKSAAIIRSFDDSRIVFLENKDNIGLTRSLNKCLRFVKGEYIARQDADDISCPQRFEKQIQYMLRNPHVGIVGSSYCLINDRGVKINMIRLPCKDHEIRWRMLFHNAFCHTSVIWKKDVMAGQVPLYNERLRFSQDFEMFNRILKHTLAANIYPPLVSVREHKEQVSRQYRDEQQGIADMISHKELRTVAPENALSLVEIRRLRNWQLKFPDYLIEGDFRLLNELLNIADRFCIEDGAERDFISTVKLDILLNAFLCRHKSRLLCFRWLIHNLMPIIRTNPKFLFDHLSSISLSWIQKRRRRYGL